MGLQCHAVTTDVLFLYPGESFRDQTGRCAVRHSQRRVNMSWERSLPEIRRLLRHTRAAVVDATEDPSQAVDAFLQAVARLGAAAVTMYTETAHDELELFVRMRGSMFLVGPLSNQAWEDVFQCLLRAKRPMPVVHASAPQRISLVHAPHCNPYQKPYLNRLWGNYFD